MVAPRIDYLGQNLRTITLDGEPWFHATDVCKCLGLRMASGATPHLARLAKNERRLVTHRTLSSIEGRHPFLGQAGQASVVSESGLYMLIMGARTTRPEVIAFQNWVTKDVLPSIRKTGGYLLNEGARGPNSQRSWWWRCSPGCG
jgi:prophage antirepressor-like protein